MAEVGVGHRPDPLGFARLWYPVAAVFLVLVGAGLGLAAWSAQSAAPVRVDDVGSFVVPEEAEDRSLYVAADRTSAFDEPPCLSGGGVMEDSGAIALPRSIDGERSRLVADLGPTEAGDRVECEALAGSPGWLAQPAGTRWLLAGMALVLLVVLTVVRALVAVVGAARGARAGEAT